MDMSMFWVVRRLEVNPDRHDLTYVDEELRSEAASVVLYDFRLRPIVKD